MATGVCWPLPGAPDPSCCLHLVSPPKTGGIGARGLRTADRTSGWASPAAGRGLGGPGRPLAWRCCLESRHADRHLWPSAQLSQSPGTDRDITQICTSGVKTHRNLHASTPLEQLALACRHPTTLGHKAAPPGTQGLSMGAWPSSHTVTQAVPEVLTSRNNPLAPGVSRPAGCSAQAPQRGLPLPVQEPTTPTHGPLYV